MIELAKVSLQQKNQRADKIKNSILKQADVQIAKT